MKKNFFKVTRNRPAPSKEELALLANPIPFAAKLDRNKEDSVISAAELEGAARKRERRVHFASGFVTGTTSCKGRRKPGRRRKITWNKVTDFIPGFRNTRVAKFKGRNVPLGVLAAEKRAAYYSESKINI